MRIGLVAILGAGLVGVCGASASAQAALIVCNKAPAPVSLTIAYETVQDVMSEGWWTIAPDQCETVVKTELNQQYIYHYAKSEQLGIEWAGTYNFCTLNSPTFRIPGGMDCESRSYRTTGFRQIDLQGAKDYTLDILSGPVAAAPSAPAAATTEAPAIEAPIVEVPAVEAPAVEESTTNVPAPAATAPAVQ